MIVKYLVSERNFLSVRDIVKVGKDFGPSGVRALDVGYDF